MSIGGHCPPIIMVAPPRISAYMIHYDDKYVTVAVDANEIWTLESAAGETGILRRGGFGGSSVEYGVRLTRCS